MDFLLQPKQTQVQLQQSYGVRKSHRAKTVFVENEDARTSDRSPHRGSPTSFTSLPEHKQAKI